MKIETRASERNRARVQPNVATRVHWRNSWSEGAGLNRINPSSQHPTRRAFSYQRVPFGISFRSTATDVQKFQRIHGRAKKSFKGWQVLSKWSLSELNVCWLLPNRSMRWEIEFWTTFSFYLSLDYSWFKFDTFEQLHSFKDWI